MDIPGPKLPNILYFALIQIARLEAFLEPVHPLLRSTVRERIGYHIALRLLLQLIVADGVGRRGGCLNVAGFYNIFQLIRVIGPYTCQEIGL